jgi:hypothetical protein
VPASDPWLPEWFAGERRDAGKAPGPKGSQRPSVDNERVDAIEQLHEPISAEGKQRINHCSL